MISSDMSYKIADSKNYKLKFILKKTQPYQSSSIIICWMLTKFNFIYFNFFHIHAVNENYDNHKMRDNALNTIREHKVTWLLLNSHFCWGRIQYFGLYPYFHMLYFVISSNMTDLFWIRIEIVHQATFK